MRRVTYGRDPRADVRALADAASVISLDRIVAIPTDTLYALAANPHSPAAIARVIAVKGRPVERAIALIGADIEQVLGQLGELPPAARRLAARYWPGPLTLLVDRPALLPAALTAGSRLVGVRVPDDETARALCRACGHLLTATSANISGEPPSDDPDDVARVFADRDVELLLDAGRTPGGPPSTVVEAAGDEIRLIRPGAIAWEDVQACVQSA